MNKQEVFEKVAKHLLKQNAKAIGYTGGCSYRDPSGLECAVGCLIPDELYDPVFEGFAVRMLDRASDELRHSQKRLRETLELLGLDDFKFLGELQCIHDNSPVSQWRDSLVAFCVKHDLDGSFLLEIK